MTNKQSIPSMLQKLNEMYDEEARLEKEMNNLVIQYRQLQEDKEMLQNLIMYQSNKMDRMRGMK